MRPSNDGFTRQGPGRWRWPGPCAQIVAVCAVGTTAGCADQARGSIGCARVWPDGQVRVTWSSSTCCQTPRRSTRMPLPAGSYTTPVRVGDTVRSRRTDETFTVTEIQVQPDGTATADALFTTGATGSGYSLVELGHVARPTVEPTSRPCKRRHPAGVACGLCTEATTPVTTACRAAGCTNAATNLVLVSRSSAGSDVTALCSDSTEQFRTTHPDKAITLIPLAAGTHGFLDEGHGTQVATCLHCCHRIRLYPALLHRDRPWRAHAFDETGRCTAHIEALAQQPVPHQPATTRGELEDARAAALCDDPERHLPDECPAHQQLPAAAGPTTRAGRPLTSARSTP
jgi:hypothetical protein